MAITDEPASLRVHQVARRLGVSQGTVRKWADSGDLACWRTPAGQRRFRPEDVDNFVKSGRGAA